jgi:hypothetical protein
MRFEQQWLKVQCAVESFIRRVFKCSISPDTASPPSQPFDELLEGGPVRFPLVHQAQARFDHLAPLGAGALYKLDVRHCSSSSLPASRVRK